MGKYPDMNAPRSLFITGGGSGLGLAVARRAVRAGWRVGIGGRSRDRLIHAAATMTAGGGAVEVFTVDVADAAAVEAAIGAFAPDALDRGRAAVHGPRDDR